jgi:hypothetical protein
MRGRGARHGKRVLLSALVALAMAQPVSDARAGSDRPVLHERIPPDAREDLAMRVSLDGNLPAALETQRGAVSAPDPRQLPSSTDVAYGTAQGQDEDAFSPDRDTRRPEVSAYDDPFTPSTAPFKRMEAFDGVRESGQLFVRDTRLQPVSKGGPAGPEEEAFYADLVVDAAPDRDVRIPSVGPGARIVQARLGVGANDIAFRVMHDGADSWFLQAYGARRPVRARLVMEVAVARAAFGGQMHDPSWSEMPVVAPLPDDIARDAAEVRAAIGVSRAMRPREAIAKLVEYFRSFAESDDPPQGNRSVYLDLALSKKGVCRHRAFAFLVTAQSLGIPTRFVLNEAHAWVEVHDGTLWKRIDLGGAGHIPSPAASSLPERLVYQPPPDAFAWPQNAARGDDMMADARARAAGSASAGGTDAPAGTSDAPEAGASPSAAAPSGPSGPTSTESSEHDERPPSAVAVALAGSDAHRGLPLRVHGAVRAEGEPCAHVPVEVWLRAVGSKKMILLGSLATGDDGAYAGSIVVPAAAPLGDYDVVARTPGDARCGSGASE